jgi:hypothetical protein
MTKTAHNDELDIDDGSQIINETGVTLGRAILIRQFITDAAKRRFSAADPGTEIPIVHVIGRATAYVEKKNMHGDKLLESICLLGTFEAVSLLDGEVRRASSAYLPMAYAEPAMITLKANPDKPIDVVIDISIYATGKTIPYEWRVRNYVDDDGSGVLKRLRKISAEINTRPALLDARQKTLLLGHTRDSVA